MGKYCEYLNGIERAFGDYFSRAGYQKVEPVLVTSGVDPSTDLIGSKISVLKPYVVRGNIPGGGLWLVQDCFRARGMRTLETIEPNKYGSCFRTMGTLTQPNLERAVFDTFGYLEGGVGIRRKDLLVKINPNDKDLMAAIRSAAGDICREEGAADAHYRHKYGLGDILGRDFNIAARVGGTDEFVSVGTVVLMEQTGRARTIAVDMGIGNLSLARCNFGTDNTLAVSRMADVFPIDCIEKQRLADSLMGLALLQKEHVREISYNGPGRNLRWIYNKYKKAAVYWKEHFRLSDQEVLRYMNEYIFLEFGDNSFKSEATWTK